MNSTRLGSLAHTLLQRAPATAALVLAVLAGATAYVAVRRQEEEVRRGWTLMPVVVANQELSLGRALTADALAERQVPEQFVTSSTVKPDAVNHVLGQRLRVPLQKGDMLLWSQLESGRETERLSGKVMKKARAVTIEAGPTASVGGWVRPNDHVDVIGTFRDPQNQDPV
ncbi:MAG TPA: Flp pilus assembly protein CpaB, partial [Myxococcaceae bacterium]|nr:Flp pilus assembly protein CpaB [Myxococcaceae bacterium]